MDINMKIKKTAIKIIILVAILGIVAILLRTSSDTQRDEVYNAAMPTAQKYAMLKKWLAPDSDLVIVADTYRLAAIPALKSFLEEGLFMGSDTAIKAIRSLIGPETRIGMLSLNANVKEAAPTMYVIVQGDFREGEFVGKVKEDLSRENMDLVSKDVGPYHLYSQGGETSTFAFAIPGRNHLLVGMKTQLEALLQQKETVEPPFPTTDSPFFGFLRSSERIKRVLPPQFSSLELAKFSADEQQWLHVTVECTDQVQADNLKMFLSGMKALYMLQNESNRSIYDSLGSAIIGGDGNTVRIDTPLAGLPSMLSDK
jgi:hypothetical protein